MGLMVLITIIGWSPQLVDFFHPGLLLLTPTIAYTICTICLLIYPAAITVFFLKVAPWMREKHGKAATLKFWEIYVSTAWQVQTIGFTCLTIMGDPPGYVVESFNVIPSGVTTVIGIALVVLGLGSKGGAIYMTGYNTYYWYDMVLNTPNAYFVEGGIYKYCGSPTYTLGRMTGFGAAIHFRSRMPQGQ